MGPIQLADGTKASIVLVGPANQPKGAVLVTQPPEGGTVEKLPLGQCLDRLTPMLAIDILCTQERAFGSHQLAPPDLS